MPFCLVHEEEEDLMDDALVKLQSIERSLLELSQQTLHTHDVRDQDQSNLVQIHAAGPIFKGPSHEIPSLAYMNSWVLKKEREKTQFRCCNSE